MGQMIILISHWKNRRLFFQQMRCGRLALLLQNFRPAIGRGASLPAPTRIGEIFLGNESPADFVYQINKAASLRAATLSPTNQPRTETPFTFW
jgi:hypothetical protein